MITCLMSAQTATMAQVAGPQDPSSPPPESDESADAREAGTTAEATKLAISNALQEWAQQGNPQQAVTTLLQAPNQDDAVVVALLAYLYGAALGQPAQGLPYFERTLSSGVAVGPTAANYVNHAVSDPSLRRRAPSFVEAGIRGGWQIDPFGIAQQLAAQGEADAAVEVIRNARTPLPEEGRRQWGELIAEAQGSREKITSNIALSEQARAQAVDRIEEHQATIRAEAERVMGLVDDTASLIQGAAAHHLANDYAQRANSARRTANLWTLATLLVGVMAIGLAAAFVLVGLSREHDVSDILTKAGISVPLLVLAAYLNRLGAEERRDARTWRHVELQIRTAQPYLANLPATTRDEVLAALALRFFPGQSQNPHAGEPDPAADDPLKLLRELQQGRPSNEA
jgi:hypothetical protein